MLDGNHSSPCWVCSNWISLKAWSQNLGHEQVLTTFMSYGKVATDRQGEIIRGIGLPKQSTQPAVEDFAEAVFKKLRDAGASLPAGQSIFVKSDNLQSNS